MKNYIVQEGNLWYPYIMEDFVSLEKERLEAEYKEIFEEAARVIRQEIEKFKPNYNCNTCTIPCDIKKVDIFQVFPPNCPYSAWQIKALSYLTNEYKAKLNVSKKTLLQKKSEYSCAKCGDCCKLAVSERSPVQLKQNAIRGDKFAREFLSIYIPYESEDMAEAICPEYYQKLKELMDENSRLYFYYCSKLGADNLCSDYENRPDICKDYPFSPIKILSDKCAYLPWHDSVRKLAMSIKARESLIAFYKDKIG